MECVDRMAGTPLLTLGARGFLRQWRPQLKGRVSPGEETGLP